MARWWQGRRDDVAHKGRRWLPARLEGEPSPGLRTASLASREAARHEELVVDNSSAMVLRDHGLLARRRACLPVADTDGGSILDMPILLSPLVVLLRLMLRLI
jgi:hypothetical protein